MNDAGKAHVADHLSKWASKIIALADSWYQLRELASTVEDKAYSSTFTPLTMLPYAVWQQTNMIERWVTLGREDTLSHSDGIYFIDRAEKHLDELTAIGALPKYPLHILTALQTFQAVQESEPDMGAQGHLYDTLVDRALKAMSEDAAGMGINRLFIALLAYESFCKNHDPLSLERGHEIADAYLQSHAMRVDVQAMLSLLVEYRFLRLEDGGIPSESDMFTTTLLQKCSSLG